MSNFWGYIKIGLFVSALIGGLGALLYLLIGGLFWGVNGGWVSYGLIAVGGVCMLALLVFSWAFSRD